MHRTVALGYFVVLSLVAALNYIPGVTDADGLTFGIFALDIYDDALHAASALWALGAAVVSARAARLYLLLFGALYLADGVLGLVTGSGYLDLGIFTWGWQDLPFSFKILANGPHLALGGFALAMGLRR
ncbi:hypothetical protein [Tabrizicola fusiformis]|uniref:hypothetical protein n=1 Tax=Tabrizicola sp. SY72 TaxID=2741673 RepID=UPI00157238A1|nr:hypothetical protein [Tabrizicola sp. SY72]NTT88457.1 hypothetical protein [Tabrizicola sp. SY72]